MGQALYRKYRTTTFAETVGQEHVTKTLENAIKQGKISHAYLFSGPRGTGKTSIARILAHEINNLPYNDEAPLDIIEIDAASNRRIDEIRDLRDRVNTAPAYAKYKVYIIDEVHMLTKEAFNALLKTLEEPPAHVIFILATTEAHKLPETILSRTQRFTLRPVAIERVVTHLRKIADGEKITIDDDALALVAQHGEGSFRDSISLLDQASSIAEHITRADIERILGLAPDDYITTLSSAISGGVSATIVTTLMELYAQGFEPAMIAQQLSASIRAAILDDQNLDSNSSLHLLERLLDVPAARSPRQLLEIILLQSALVAATPTYQPARKAETVVQTPKEPVPQPEHSSSTVVKVTEASPIPSDTPPVPVVAEPTVSVSDIDAEELWHQALEAIKKQYNTLYGIARMAHPEFDGTTLTLSFKFAFHQKRVNEAKNRKIFGDIVEKFYGQPVQIVCVIAPETAVPPQAPDVSTIANVFGGAELLKS
ncbi:MAG TPA: DNA polymerase III subunit gamma/tau [Verrucomicrobiae bacterium]|nr:DNA polymerase III subunit gamma/tau [Verrucomicrobiae bacterium]